MVIRPANGNVLVLLPIRGRGGWASHFRLVFLAAVPRPLDGRWIRVVTRRFNTGPYNVQPSVAFATPRYDPHPLMHGSPPCFSVLLLPPITH